MFDHAHCQLLTYRANFESNVFELGRTSTFMARVSHQFWTLTSSSLFSEYGWRERIDSDHIQSPKVTHKTVHNHLWGRHYTATQKSFLSIPRKIARNRILHQQSPKSWTKQEKEQSGVSDSVGQVEKSQCVVDPHHLTTRTSLEMIFKFFTAQ